MRKDIKIQQGLKLNFAIFSQFNDKMTNKSYNTKQQVSNQMPIQQQNDIFSIIERSSSSILDYLDQNSINNDDSDLNLVNSPFSQRNNQNYSFSQQRIHNHFRKENHQRQNQFQSQQQKFEQQQNSFNFNSFQEKEQIQKDYFQKTKQKLTQIIKNLLPYHKKLQYKNAFIQINSITQQIQIKEQEGPQQYKLYKEKKNQKLNKNWFRDISRSICKKIKQKMPTYFDEFQSQIKIKISQKKKNKSQQKKQKKFNLTRSGCSQNIFNQVMKAEPLEFCLEVQQIMKSNEFQETLKDHRNVRQVKDRKQFYLYKLEKCRKRLQAIIENKMKNQNQITE